MLAEIKKMIPDIIKTPINKIRNQIRWNRQLNAIVKFYANKVDINEEEQEAIQYLKKINGLTVFPYDFNGSWDFMSINVFKDISVDMLYVVHNGYRLYFKRGLSEIDVKGIYFGLMNEQSEKSPHLYLTKSFNIEDNSVIADIGSAEGIFTLNSISSISKAYLFEPDPLWVEALEQTFKPWKEKIIIIKKYVGSTDSESTIALDSFFKEIQLDFIKADIEGAESAMLLGADQLLRLQHKLKLAITTYHKQSDFDQFYKLLTNKYGFKADHSYGYMLYFINNDLEPPYLRRGIIRAERNNN